MLKRHVWEYKQYNFVFTLYECIEISACNANVKKKKKKTFDKNESRKCSEYELI